MSRRFAIAASIAVAVLASACQSVIESGDEAPLPPLGTPLAAMTTSTTTVPTTTSSTTIAPTTTSTTTTTTTTTTLPATTSTAATTTTSTTTTSTTSTTSTVPATTTTEPFYSDEPSSGTLSEGDRGERTKAMQAKLVTLGYLDPGADDGLFGKLTTAAVKEFQADNDLEVDGLVGPRTSAELDDAVADN